MDTIANKDSVIKEAVWQLKELSDDERARMLHEYRKMARMDANAWKHHMQNEGRAQGHAEVARKLLEMNMPIEDIVKATGLTQEEIKNLRDTN